MLYEAASDAAVYAELTAGLKATTEALRASPIVMARALQPGFKVRPHGRVISNAFVELAKSPSERVVDRVLLVTPPQVGKTEIAAIWAPFWWLVNRPAHRVVVASYNTDLALKRGQRTREIVRWHGGEFALSLSPWSASAHDWELSSGGGMRSVGVGAGLTGHSADLLVIDDPHKDRAEANSIRMREAVWEWWSSTANSRLQPGSVMVVILTRWHPDDLAGRLLREQGREEEGGRWRVLHMPAIAMAPDPARGIYADALGREPGEPLPHPKIPLRDTEALLAHWREKRRTSLVRDWHALYQGNPQPDEGALVSYGLLRDIRELNPTAEPQKAAVAVDPSGGGRDVAGVVGGWLGEDGRLYITADRSGVMRSDEWSVAACELAVELDADLIIVETNYGGDMATLTVRTAWDKLRRDEAEARAARTAVAPGAELPPARFERLPPRIKAVRARMGKLLRAEPIAQQMLMDRVRLAAYMPDLEQEWAVWQPDDPDSPGRIDASVYLAYGLLKVPGANTVMSSPTAVTRDQVDTGGSSQLSRASVRPQTRRREPWR